MPPIPYLQALSYAKRIVDWLTPHCELIEIAGSIRRQRKLCGDVDLVIIPRVTVQHDLLGVETERKNHVWTFIKSYVDTNPSRAKWLSGGELPGKFCSLQFSKVQLDIWFADEASWASQLICRTGSKEHNIWLAQRASEQGFHWFTSTGLNRSQSGSQPIPAPDEATFYGVLGLGFIHPHNRERDWISENLESGL